MFDRLLLNLPGFKRIFTVLIIFSLLESACIVGQAIGLSRGLTMPWEGSALESALLNLGIFACCFISVRIVLNLREAYISSQAQSVAAEIRKKVLASVFRTGAPAVQQFGSATLSTMAIEGVDKVKEYLELVLPKLANLFVLPVVFAIAITRADWVSGIVVIILLPAMILLMNLIGKTTADNARAQHASFKIMSNHFLDSVRGIGTLSTFKSSKTYARRVYEVSEKFREATIKTLKTATLSGAVLDLFATLALAAVAIMLGMRLIDGSLLLLPALFVLILVPEFFRPIREFAADYHASLEGLNSLKTILTILDSTPKAPEPVLIPEWNEGSHLQAKGISRKYDGMTVLSDICFDMNGYERIGVIGVSGAGKSTLLRILVGLEDPSSGAFSISGLPQNLSSLRQASWQDKIAYIPQNPYIFHMSLRDNLKLYNPNVSDTEVAAAIQNLGLNELVSQLPDGLDTILGEGGRGLSGGQAQRIALARVLLDKKRKILLFDEPTAHLDIETEYELKAPMKKIMQDKLVLFATHRLHWLDSFDRVLVLGEGELVEQGSVDALLDRDGVFSELVSALRGGVSA